jgi:hypothetical protein
MKESLHGVNLCDCETAVYGILYDNGLEHCGRHDNTALVILCGEMSKAGNVSCFMESFNCLLLSDYVAELREDIADGALRGFVCCMQQYVDPSGGAV